jgi:hypothetical protein
MIKIILILQIQNNNDDYILIFDINYFITIIND